MGVTLVYSVPTYVPYLDDWGEEGRGGEGAFCLRSQKPMGDVSMLQMQKTPHFRFIALCCW